MDWIGVSAYGPLTLDEDWGRGFRAKLDGAYPKLAALSPTDPIAVLEYGAQAGEGEGALDRRRDPLGCQRPLASGTGARLLARALAKRGRAQPRTSTSTPTRRRCAPIDPRDRPPGLQRRRRPSPGPHLAQGARASAAAAAAASRLWTSTLRRRSSSTITTRARPRQRLLDLMRGSGRPRRPARRARRRGACPAPTACPSSASNSCSETASAWGRKWKIPPPPLSSTSSRSSGTSRASGEAAEVVGECEVAEHRPGASARGGGGARGGRDEPVDAVRSAVGQEAHPRAPGRQEGLLVAHGHARRGQDLVAVAQVRGQSSSQTPGSLLSLELR